jgi:chloramphenicol 3-O phosphotransferase
VTGRIVVLNGAGSVGKSAVARAMQGRAQGVVLHAAMDVFMEMAPPAVQEGPEGFDYVSGPQGVTVRVGPFGQRLMAAMIPAVAALAGTGDCVVFDAVLDAGQILACRRGFAGHQPVFVGLMATLPVLEAREKARGDRMIGLARDQVAWVHRGVSYDLTVDCDEATPEAIAAQICERFGL